LIGVELADTDRFGRAADLAEWLMYEALARGLSFKVSAGTVLTLCPALVITRPQMDEALDILSDCLTAAANRG
jgi:4-aminobutyrate aminotransferase